MSTFDDAWLRDHQTRMAGFKPPPVASIATPNLIAFTLSRPTILLNTLLRMPWQERHRHAKALSAEVAGLVPHDPHRKPFNRASVVIRRLSTGVPDHEAATGGVKILVDTLIVRSTTHPHGLGLIEDDAPGYLELTVTCERVGKQAEQGTMVTIENLPW